MRALSLVGIVAFTVASLVLGVKLLRLGRRTRELPELAMGASFAASGGLGFPCIMAAALMHAAGADPTVGHWVGSVGIWCLSAGSLLLAIGNWRIYRPSSRAAYAGVVAMGLALAASCGAASISDDSAPGGLREVALWIALEIGAVAFVWGAVEAFALYDTLRRRARIGLARAEVANRVLLWGIGGVAAAAMSLYSLGQRIVIGPELDDAQRMVTSIFGMVGATAVWLAFFPPVAYRRLFDTAATREHA